jgi:surfeit locus 1 family protein
MTSLAPSRPARAIDWHRLLIVGLIAVAGTALLTGLGVWQLERRLWKLDLIRKVDARFHAPAHALPQLDHIDARAHEYEHVIVNGTYLPHLDTWVHAATERGSGFWILSPLRLQSGNIVLINRGFVPLETTREQVAPGTEHSVTGVLRSSEPNGVWPRRNHPAEDRWYSRDVAAIAQARGLAGVAPVFIDADAGPEMTDRAPPGPVRPQGGLTVVQFRNEHLTYALTWFVLALMTASAGCYALRGDLRGTFRQS